jgi:hypothetical protein
VLLKTLFARQLHPYVLFANVVVVGLCQFIAQFSSWLTNLLVHPKGITNPKAKL